MKVPPPGFSLFVCLRRTNGTPSSRQWVLYHRKNTREYHSRSGYKCPFRSPVIITSRSPAGQYAEFTSCRYISQATAAVHEVHYNISESEDSVPEIPQSLEKLTVKELRLLLASRSMKTVGVKKELIERLQSVSQGEIAATSLPPSEGNNQPPPDNASLHRAKVSEEFSKMSVKELRDMLTKRGLPTTGLKAQLVERLENAEHPNGLGSQNKELGILSSTEPPDAETTTSYEEWLGQIERQLALAKQDTALLVSQCSLLRAFLDLEDITTLSRLRLLNQLERELTLCEHQNVLLHIDLSVSQISSILSMIRARKRLQTIAEQLETSIAQIIHLKNHLQALTSEIPSHATSTPIIPASPTPVQTEVQHRRVVALGTLYFNKIFNESLYADPRTTKGVILSELREPDARILCAKFRRIVREWAMEDRKLEQREHNEAWLLALEYLAGIPGSERYCVKGERVGGQRWRVEKEPVDERLSASKEVSKRKVATLAEEKDSGSRVQLSDNQWKALLKLRLSQNPVTLRLQLNNSLRRKYQEQSGPDNNTKKVGYMFDSMWTRLGLSDHISTIRPGENDSEYLVTFKTFDAAAAFVNQVHGHWIDDEMTGQVYATWDPIETHPNNVRAILTLPRASMEPWRNAAAKRFVPRSKYGFPLVDWEQSLLSVFMRMNLTYGRKGNCWLWKRVGEYDHVVILEIGFATTEMMKRFVNSKSQHYLSNPWKDRFFVKQKDRYLYPVFTF